MYYVEIFEIFNVLFTEIQSSPTNFMIDNKPYTLYARMHGPKDDIAIMMYSTVQL